MRKVKVAVIGGGISGVSFAHYLSSSDSLLIEKEDRLGGLCRSIVQDGFVWDYSGHFLHFNSDDIKADVVSLVSDEMRQVRKKSKVIYHDRIIDFPFQQHIHQLPFSDFLDCLRSYLNRPSGTCDSFKSLLVGRFGEGISRRFLIPYGEKVYACDLNALSVQAMGRFFPKGSIWRTPLMRNYNDSFYYFPNGIERLVEGYSKKLPQENILLNTVVQGIDLEDRCIDSTNGIIRYDDLVVTIPLSVLLGLLPENVPQVQYSYSRVAVFNFGFDSGSDHDAHWYYVPDSDIIFYRVGQYSAVGADARMSLYVEVGLDSKEHVELDFLRERVIDDLRRIGFIRSQRVVSSSQMIIDPAYVHITPRSIDRVGILSTYLQGRNVHLLGRYAQWKYCSIEDCIGEAKGLAKLFK